MTAGSDLRAVLELVSPTLRRASEMLWQEPDPRATYHAYLVAMHGVVRASVPLMNLALDRSRREGPHDRVLSALADRLPWHIREEQGHDACLERDMAAAGLDPRRELARTPSAEVAALVGAQFYWIDHYHPACLLGYIAALEFNAPDPGLAEVLSDRAGLPSAAFSTIRLHAQLDPGHGTAILALLDEADPDADLASAIRISALHTVRALSELFDAIRLHRS